MLKIAVCDDEADVRGWLEGVLADEFGGRGAACRIDAFFPRGADARRHGSRRALPPDFP